MIESHDLETDLNLTTDFTGHFERITSINSSGISIGDVSVLDL